MPLQNLLVLIPIVAVLIYAIIYAIIETIKEGF